MQKKILVAVDESLHAKNASLYAAYFNSDSSIQLTLLNIRTIISDYFVSIPKSDPIMTEEMDRVLAEIESKSLNILRENKKTLINMGIKNSSITTVSQKRELGLAKDIIVYGLNNKFNAVVIGRRGISRIQKVFMGSTSAKVMGHAYKLPVWIVDGEVRPRRFLVTVNLNSTALVDYIVHMCKGMHNIHITFFYVKERFRLSGISPNTTNAIQLDMIIDRQELDLLEHWWTDAMNRLKSVGFNEAQMELKTVQRTGKTGKMILDEIENHTYDTVIIGRTGSGKAYYFGSVSRYVSERLTGHALWIIGNP